MKIEIELDDFLIDHLKMWKDEGVPAPVNELQSIAAWLRESCNVKEMQDKMRKRMLMLMTVAGALDEQHGVDGAVLAGIYANRPDLLEEAKKVVAERG